MKNIAEFSFGWLVGILEGEGSFMGGPPSNPNNPRITMQVTDRDVAERACEHFETSVISVKMSKKGKARSWKDTFVARVTGKRAARLMLTLKPYMSIRRQGQVERALENYNPNLREELCRITRDQANEIRFMKSNGYSAKELAGKFGISWSYVYDICRYEKRIREI